MSTTALLPAQPRTALGTANSRRLRQEGQIPATLYGLNQDPVSLTVAAETAKPIILAGAHVVDIEVDGNVEMAMIRDVQWDTFLMHILHLDLQRIDRGATIEVEVPIEAKGSVKDGVLDQPLHTLTLSCLAHSVPEKMFVRVGTLDIGDEIIVADLEIPEGTSTAISSDTVVMRVTAVQDIDIVQEDVSAAAEPEVIGAKADDEADG